ncbi:MAG: hypothetical protein DRO99_02040 [Candidatus Aenigmatarchaeota archaeon]|nr:MAG: hypothetical protein DRO99_02040 [Candidatus Aenigmarchaeota archaeon]
MQAMSEEMNQKVEALIKIPEERKREIDAILEQIFKELTDGPSVVSDPSKRYTLPQGLKFKMSTGDRIPKTLFEYNDLSNRLYYQNPPKNKVKRLKNRMKRLRRILQDDYDFDPNKKPTKVSRVFAEQLVSQLIYSKTGKIANRGHESWNRNVDDFLRINNQTVFTQDEIEDILRDYGFEDFIDTSWIDQGPEPPGN